MLHSAVIKVLPIGKMLLFFSSDRLVGLVVTASASRAADPGLNPALSVGILPGRDIPVTSKLALQWLPCQAPGDIGSVLGLVGSVRILNLGEVESLICNFYLSVAARALV